MNKLKGYRISLLISLFIALTISSTFFSLLLVDFITNISSLSVMDYVMYTICFVLLVVINITQIVNTFISFKSGSNFIKFLCFDANGDKNTPLLNFCVIGNFFFILGIIYLIVIKNNVTLPLGTLNDNIKNFIISCFSLVIIDLIFIYLFQYFGLEDPSMKKKQK